MEGLLPAGRLAARLALQLGVYSEYRDDPEPYAELIQGDMFAMAVAALMYDPWLGRGGD